MRNEMINPILGGVGVQNWTPTNSFYLLSKVIIAMKPLFLLKS